MLWLLQSLQSTQPAANKTKKTATDETIEVNQKNTSSTVVQSSSMHKTADSVKPTGHVPASIRNIQRLSTMDNKMTNGSRCVTSTTLTLSVCLIDFFADFMSE